MEARMVELPFRARGEVAWLQTYGLEPRKVAAARAFQRLMSTF